MGEKWLKRLALSAAVLFFGAVAVTAVALQQRGDGPVVPIWDRDACAHCHMHVGEPGFAAQLHDADGRVYHYDDPGCLLLDLPRRTVRALWFRHAHEDRWLRGDRVGFAEVGPSPMGHGLGAVDPTTPGALTLQAAIERVSAQKRTRP